ncbi:hypothetical protein B5807_00481 [Epicoccum nigrum]|jgi:hypothetical protein|uniref:Uncharacterized protein n=1 Tax=Epicoccum nigrum TaxID=105696 RepID=A0A1Y2MCR1_EPING|nr:hypothetical protein B5807_00481 [Epicoccum nigrum]
MTDLDGACSSKLASESHHEQTIPQQPEHKPTKLRRFMSIGSRRSKAASKAELNTKPDSATSLQVFSPRSAGSDLQTKKHKRSVSTFLSSRLSTHKSEPPKRESGVEITHIPVTETSFLSAPPAATKETKDNTNGQSHLPLTGDPYHPVQMQPRKDSAIKAFHEVPAAPSRTAALRSHPVQKEDLEEEYTFHTPDEFWGRHKTDYWGRKNS